MVSLSSSHISPIYFAFLSCMQDSNLDVTIGPYETYEDGLFSYKVFSQDPCTTCSWHFNLFIKSEPQVTYTTYSFEFCPLWSTL